MTSNWQATERTGWYKTHCMGAFFARINGSLYSIMSKEGHPNGTPPKSILECNDEKIGELEGTIFNGHERSRKVMEMAEHHAALSGRLVFGENPVPLEETVTLNVE